MLRKVLALGHKAIVVINKIDRPDAVIDDVVNRTFDLFVHLGATDEQLDFPIVHAAAIKGQATLDVNKPGTDITPLLDTVLEKIPAPAINAEAPLQDPRTCAGPGFLQRQDGHRKDSVRFDCTPTECDTDVRRSEDSREGLRSGHLPGLERVDADQASAGEIVAVAGLDEVSIGDTIADAENPDCIAPRDDR